LYGRDIKWKNMILSRFNRKTTYIGSANNHMLR
jgi:hypothetical protein